MATRESLLSRCFFGTATGNARSSVLRGGTLRKPSDSIATPLSPPRLPAPPGGGFRGYNRLPNFWRRGRNAFLDRLPRRLNCSTRSRLFWLHGLHTFFCPR